MKLVFASNYLNHHQLPLCEELYRLTDGNFRFVAFSRVSSSRLSLGYSDMSQLPFVIRAYEDEAQREEAKKWCLESDVMIHASAPEGIVTMRLAVNLPVFRYSERLFKAGMIHALSPRVMKSIYEKHTKYRDKPVYMLCASAFTAKDFAIMGAYKKRAYRWGYFPELIKYDDIDVLIAGKKKGTIAWVGRLIDWKHPELALEVASRLKADGYEFSLDMIGSGPMEQELRQRIVDCGLETNVTLHGSMPPEKVREYMEQSEIFLFTSDRNEGWGAVLNESMNSACAVVASHMIGSVPFLLDHQVNGLVYRDGDVKDLFRKVKSLLDDPENRRKLSKKAYATMTEQWNAENAARRLLALFQAVIDGVATPDLFETGVCSKAPLLGERWHKK